MKGFILLLSVLVVEINGSLVESHAFSKDLQRAVRHNDFVIVIEGVRRRMIGIPSPDPLLLINFPDLDNQFKVHLLEDTGTIKLTLVHPDGVWCEDINLGSELQLLKNQNKDDHLVIAFDQSGHGGSKVTVFFSCIGKGQVRMPFSLRQLKQKMKHSKLKMYHPRDVAISIQNQKSANSVLVDLNCQLEKMQVQNKIFHQNTLYA
ncbi:uncharacterized protein LOC111699660 [Eurytemora carolleeae]|uniref:uncharacterized protein LOC111699660 n=1 Tax=Eurytemora carolleeae TaxID=1294199 RepID=UPI000C786208|nr:uncharacterized protein LOC111699660 [Eurytemora carolleeae]|eukprot:XP_023326151.1 uncharacterized protein LOC111699660 [Eurytemora affinis]